MSKNLGEKTVWFLVGRISDVNLVVANANLVQKREDFFLLTRMRRGILIRLVDYCSFHTTLPQQTFLSVVFSPNLTKTGQLLLLTSPPFVNLSALWMITGILRGSKSAS